MLIDGLVNSGATPVLEMSIKYAAQRQTLLAHNIANIETPDFRPMDVAPAEFQRVLSQAVQERRKRGGGALNWEESKQLRHDAQGSLKLVPKTPSGNILFHDRNNRDVERLMQDLAENTSAFRLASDLLRSRMELTRLAISQRA
jgi:flagellar basal-body rod protein FlgB